MLLLYKPRVSLVIQNPHRVRVRNQRGEWGMKRPITLHNAGIRKVWEEQFYCTCIWNYMNRWVVKVSKGAQVQPLHQSPSVNTHPDCVLLMRRVKIIKFTRFRLAYIATVMLNPVQHCCLSFCLMVSLAGLSCTYWIIDQRNNLVLLLASVLLLLLFKRKSIRTYFRRSVRLVSMMKGTYLLTYRIDNVAMETQW